MKGIWFGTDPEAGTVIVQDNGGYRWRPVVSIFNDPEKIWSIGLDGHRDTASLEFRPGIQESGEVLVHQLYELINMAVEHYHPPRVQYRTGAWVDPEPLGGHVHVSWDGSIRPAADDIRRMITGLNITHGELTSSMFRPNDLSIRHQYAVSHQKDFGRPGTIRPHDIRDVLVERHVEYRYPPSWLLTPEMAYCYLGSAEVLANIALLEGTTSRTRWKPIFNAMFVEGTLNPEGGPSLARAYQIAKQHLQFDTDFTANWK